MQTSVLSTATNHGSDMLCFDDIDVSATQQLVDLSMLEAGELFQRMSNVGTRQWLESLQAHVGHQRRHHRDWQSLLRPLLTIVARWTKHLAQLNLERGIQQEDLLSYTAIFSCLRECAGGSLEGGEALSAQERIECCKALSSTGVVQATSKLCSSLAATSSSRGWSNPAIMVAVMTVGQWEAIEGLWPSACSKLLGKEGVAPAAVPVVQLCLLLLQLPLPEPGMDSGSWQQRIHVLRRARSAACRVAKVLSHAFTLDSTFADVDAAPESEKAELWSLLAGEKITQLFVITTALAIQQQQLQRNSEQASYSGHIGLLQHLRLETDPALQVEPFLEKGTLDLLIQTAGILTGLRITVAMPGDSIDCSKGSTSSRCGVGQQQKSKLIPSATWKWLLMMAELLLDAAIMPESCSAAMAIIMRLHMQSVHIPGEEIMPPAVVLLQRSQQTSAEASKDMLRLLRALLQDSAPRLIQQYKQRQLRADTDFALVKNGLGSVIEQAIWCIRSVEKGRQLQQHVNRLGISWAMSASIRTIIMDRPIACLKSLELAMRADVDTMLEETQVANRIALSEVVAKVLLAPGPGASAYDRLDPTLLAAIGGNPLSTSSVVFSLLASMLKALSNAGGPSQQVAGSHYGMTILNHGRFVAVIARQMIAALKGAANGCSSSCKDKQQITDVLLPRWALLLARCLCVMASCLIRMLQSNSLHASASAHAHSQQPLIITEQQAAHQLLDLLSVLPESLSDVVHYLGSELSNVGVIAVYDAATADAAEATAARTVEQLLQQQQNLLQQLEAVGARMGGVDIAALLEEHGLVKLLQFAFPGNLAIGLQHFALSTAAQLPSRRCCNNLACSNMAGLSESELGDLTCAACKTARFCSQPCQRQFWKHHRPVCERLKAGTASSAPAKVTKSRLEASTSINTSSQMASPSGSSTGASGPHPLPGSALQAANMNVKSLKVLLQQLSVDTTRAVEKRDLVELLVRRLQLV